MKKIVKATAENLRELKSLRHEYFEKKENPSLDILEKLNRLISGLDWSVEIFEENGKKGIKDVDGMVIVPALFDEVANINRFVVIDEGLPVIVAKEGRYGLVKSDGSGEMVLNCEHDAAYNNAVGFCVTDNGRTGLVNNRGEFLVGQIADKIYEPDNGFYLFSAEGKFGLYEKNSSLLVDAVYDDISIEPDEFILVTKVGVQGFLSAEDGHFIAKEVAESEDFEGELLCNVY